MKQYLPAWVQGWLGTVTPIVQALLIVLAAWLLQQLVRRIVHRLMNKRGVPPEMGVALHRVSGGLIGFGALLLVLERLGVSGTVLWTAFTSFAAVGAVAFFAAWSVLSNIFCTLLIFTTRPFRLNDTVELLENGEKPGIRGRVIDINLIYTTLVESGDLQNGSTVQIPNNLFFQRTLRRWCGDAVPPLPERLPSATPTAPAIESTAP